MNKLENYKKITIIALVLTILFVSMGWNVFSTDAKAQSSDEIAKTIEQKKQELDKLKSDLNRLEKESEQLSSKKSGVAGSISDLENQIEQVENEIRINELKIQELDKEKEIKQLEISTRKSNLNEKLQRFYLISQQINSASTLENASMDNYWMDEYYSRALIQKEKDKIDRLSEEVLGIVTDITEFEQSKGDFVSQNKDLAIKKVSLELELSNIQNNLNKNNSIEDGLANGIGSIQQQLYQLEAQYNAKLEEERKKMESNLSEDIVVLTKGEYYFTGKLRDIYNGHYVGMSQWGAFAMATAGKSYNEILKHFYLNTVVEQVSAPSTIWIIYCPNNPLYDTAPGACPNTYVKEEIGLDTYLGGLSEVPSSWPIEAKKAQIVAARTYALSRTGNGSPSYPICTTAACQAYSPGRTTFYDVAQATHNVAITSSGQYISAMYTASACGYTENSENIFYSIVPYLRSSDYSSFRQYSDQSRLNTIPGSDEFYGTYVSKDPCNFVPSSSFTGGWRTNGYNITDLSSIINDILRSMGYSSVGEIQAINITRSSRGYAARVEVKGANGVVTGINAYNFKYHWNLHPKIFKPNYIYGIDFDLILAN